MFGLKTHTKIVIQQTIHFTTKYPAWVQEQTWKIFRGTQKYPSDSLRSFIIEVETKDKEIQHDNDNQSIHP